MEESLNKQREKYKLIYQRGIESITDYLPGYSFEAENLTYFEKQDEYPVNKESEFRIEFNLDTSDSINYQLTALSILRAGGKLSILLWQDFENFIAEWLLFQGWCVTKKTIPQNGGINITTTKYVEIRKNDASKSLKKMRPRKRIPIKREQKIKVQLV